MANPLDMVTQDQSADDEGNPLRRVYITRDQTPGEGNGNPYQPQTINSPLAQAVAPPQDDIMTLIARVKDRLLGANGQERYQTWPERMVREGFTAPGEVLARTEPSTSESLVEPAMATSALASGSTLFNKPGAATLGSGLTRPGPQAMPAAEAPVFYSALEHAATNAAQDTMTGPQWAGYLKNQPGVKGEELAWTGLPEWLSAQKGKVSKEDVQRYLDEHKVEIKDVTKSHDDVSHIDLAEARNKFEMDHGRMPRSEQELLDYARGLNEYADGELGGTKYPSYQLPGGENYREHLLTLPEKKTPYNEDALKKLGEANRADMHFRKEMVDKYQGEWHKLTPEENAKMDANYAEIEKWRNLSNSDKRLKEEQSEYKSSHWDEPNVLAHVRTNDRDVGGVPSLHLEEIQSDWHQQGRKQGYQRELKPEDLDMRRVESTVPEGHNPKNYPGYWESYDKNGGLVSRHAGHLNEAQARAEAVKDDSISNSQRTPQAPFKTSWPELALKRMIRMAAEEGKTRISWTPGEAQAARYDLSKSIDTLSYDPKTGVLKGFKGKDPVLNKVSTAEELPDVIGKEAAKKLLETELQPVGIRDVPHHVLEGEELKVGGEGMKGFYDNMLPKMVEKLGKAHGVKVQKAELAPDSEKLRSAIRYADSTGDRSKIAEAKKTQTVHYFDIPEAWRDQALRKGFPLYMSGIPFPLTPVDHDPFAKKEKK